MKVQLFIPCFVDQLYPRTAFNMIKVLEKACCEVQSTLTKLVAGKPAFNAGFRDESREVCTKFMKIFRVRNLLLHRAQVVSVFIRNYYPKLFENASVHNQVKDMGKRSYEFTEFLTDVLKIENMVLNSMLKQLTMTAVLRCGNAR